MEQLAEATAGGLGAVVSTACLFPVNKVKIRMQADQRASKKPSNFLTTLREVIKEGGPLRLLAGIRPALSKGFVNNFIFYYAYSTLKRLVFKEKAPTVARSMLHGICAGMCVQLIMSPWDTTLTQVMTFRGKGQAGGFFATAKRIFEQNGPGGFYSGIVPMLILTLNPGISTVVRNKLTARYKRPTTARENFWIGAMSKAVASTCTYPFVVAKVVLQNRKRAASISGEMRHELRRRSLSGSQGDLMAAEAAEKEAARQRKNTPPSMVETLFKIVKAGGIGALYKGCGVHISQAVAKEALLNMIRLQIVTFVMFALTGKRVTALKKK